MKTAFTLLFLSFFAFASDHADAIKAEILGKILGGVSLGKELLIWSDNKDLSAEFEKKGTFATTAHCKDATLLILENKANLDKNCHEKAVFVLDYTLLKDVPQSFGAIFWKKGRPNIVILAPRAKAHSITISNTLDEYVEEKVW